VVRVAEEMIVASALIIAREAGADEARAMLKIAGGALSERTP
jgi:hypothetical protein